MRKTFTYLHRYAGLTLGLLFTLQGLTGSLLVFDHAIDEQINPQLLLSQPTDQSVPLTQVLAAAQAAVPTDALATRLDLPRRADGVHTLRFKASDGRLLDVTVDPYTGRATSVREWGAEGMSWVYRLHYTLLAGNTGNTLVGILGIALLLLSLIGLYLWWPRGGRWRSVLKLRLGHGFLPLHYDLHHWAGVLVAPMLVVISFAGIYIVFASAFHAASDRLFPPVPQPVPALQLAHAATVDVDAAAAIAAQLYSQGELKRIFLPKADGAFRVTLRQPGEPRRSGGLTDVWVSRDGQVERVRDYSSSNPGQRFLAWLFPLHNGEAFGLPGRILVAVVGLAPAVLFVTGLSLWMIKRRRRAAP